MSIRSTTKAAYLDRSSGVPTGNFTLSVWFKLYANPTNYATIFWRGGSSGNDEIPFFGVEATTPKLHLYTNTADYSGSTLTLSTWYHIVLVRNSSTDWKVYLNGVQDISGTNETSATINQMRLWSDRPFDVGNGDCNAAMAAIKLWDTNLSVLEIQQEGKQFLPFRTANLISFLPCSEPTVADCAKDKSGAGNDWTVGGTPTIEDGPPIAWSRPRGARLFIPAAAAGGTVTGTLSQTQAGDSASSTATVLVTGTLSTSQAGNTLSSAATVLVTGTASVTQAGNTSSAAATVLVVGTLSTTQAGNTLSTAGGPIVTATLNATQDGNTLSSSASAGAVTGTLNATQAGNTCSAAATVTVTGIASITQAGNSSSAAATVLVTGAASLTQAGNSSSSTATVTVTGTASSSQANQTCNAAGTVKVTGSLNATQAGDSLDGKMGGVTAILNVSQAGNTLVARIGASQVPGWLEMPLRSQFSRTELIGEFAGTELDSEFADSAIANSQ